MAPDRFIVPVRIIMEHPVPGVTIALQRDVTARAEWIPAVTTSPEALAFDLQIGVAGSRGDGRPRLLGPFVQGPPAARFIYLCVGRAADQIGSEWNRRVKVPLGGISWELLRELPKEGRLEACIAGRGRDGSPACATVPLLPPGWRIC